jgi:bacterioferritin-associated ferredoxin
MYICICNAVTDSDIRQAVDGGVRNLRQLKQQTGCSTGCGNCQQAAREALNDALRERRDFLTVVASPSAA